LRVSGVQQHGDRGQGGHDFLEQLEPLAAQLRRNDAEAGQISTRPRQISNQTRGNRIADDRHDDRNGGARRLERLRRRRPAGDDDVRPAADQLGRKPRQRLQPVLSPFPLDLDGASLDIPELSQAIQQRPGAQRERFRRARQQHANARNFCCVLRADDRRSQCRGRRNNNELAPSH
jgi:hypothetical protein